MSDARDPEVGTWGEEAAKLIGALSGWARDQADGAGEGLSGVADRAAAAARDVDEHLAMGSAECTVCPVCRTVHAVRQLSPEVRAHLTTAVGSLAQAAAALLATPDQRSGGRTAPDVEHIDVDAADWPDTD